MAINVTTENPVVVNKETRMVEINLEGAVLHITFNKFRELWPDLFNAATQVVDGVTNAILKAD